MGLVDSIGSRNRENSESDSAIDKAITKRDALTRKLYADSMQGELQELLRYGDRNSMAWSREVRQPFLDHRLAELVFALPSDYKLYEGETKVVMRHAFKDLIPPSITTCLCC